ncbi:hypothetical protein P4307_32780 [Brevibacillus porteri]|uniref:hypothetical protein n=1 Tax=Bacillales TaxID=1385 RepID=UPI0007BFC4C5|nr:hypothetical protein [Brevibacillus porteri]MCP1097191.1 hypothetical protein [Bacillaceae bacterium OS4b]MED2748921.1 hypothetical protein [Brevibacillus porteri]
MARRLLTRIIKFYMNLTWLAGFLFSCHLVFYPNGGGISVAEDWKNIIYYFSQGVICQYCLLHFFNEQDQESN